MAKITWTSDLSLGIPVIDRQHMQIVDYLNEIDDLLVSDEHQKIGHVIEEVIDYTVSHFVFEEELMGKAGYSFIRPHQKIHDIFVRHVNKLKDRFLAGEDVLEEMHDLLSRWLLSHIRVEDWDYAETVKAYIKASGEEYDISHDEEPEEYLNLTHEDFQVRKRGWLARLFGHHTD